MTSALHALRPLALASLDLAVGTLLFAMTTSPLGLVVIAIGLLVLCHVAYSGLTQVRARVSDVPARWRQRTIWTEK